MKVRRAPGNRSAAGRHAVLAAVVFFTALSVRAGYPVRVEGVADSRLRSGLQAASQTYQLRKQPPPSDARLRRRVENDLPRLQEVLRAAGYYRATVTGEVSIAKRGPRVTFTVRPETQYVLAPAEVSLVEPDEASVPEFRPENLLPAGEPAATRVILDAEKQLVEMLQSQGYPFARVARRRVVVDHETAAVTVEWEVRTGRRMRFGSLGIEGLERLRSSAVRRFLPWKEGDWFNIREVEMLETMLLRSGVFSTSRFEVEPGEDGRADIRLQVTERKPRSLRLGVNYRTDIGWGGSILWEHRNLFGQAENLELMFHADPTEQAGEISFKRPGFFGPTRRLLLNIKGAREQTDAYDSDYGETLISIEQNVTPRLQVSLGSGYRYARVVQQEEDNRFGLVYLPLRVDWNRGGSLLDPQKGVRLIGEVAPYADTLGEDIAWLRSTLEFRPYIPLLKRPHTLLAGRFVAGNLSGQPRDAIPPDERFYAGGGGSVRGYEYQKVGPLAEDGSPLGGTTLLEASLELRTRLSQAWGLVVFVDGGSVFDSDIEIESDTVLWGAGFGIRYYTGLGPFRADLAFPLNPRDEVDDDYEFYISFGQAF